MGNSSTDINHNNRLNTEFAEAVYQQMASIRFGIKFCCAKDLNSLIIRKEQLSLRQEGYIEITGLDASCYVALESSNNFIVLLEDGGGLLRENCE